MSPGLRACRVRVDLQCLTQDMERLRTDLLSLWPHSETASDLSFKLEQTRAEIFRFLKEAATP